MNDRTDPCMASSSRIPIIHSVSEVPLPLYSKTGLLAMTFPLAVLPPADVKSSYWGVIILKVNGLWHRIEDGWIIVSSSFDEWVDPESLDSSREVCDSSNN